MRIRRWSSVLMTSLTCGALCLTAVPATPSEADSGTPEDRTILVTFDAAQSDAAAQAEQAVSQAGGTVTAVRQLSSQIAAVEVSDVTPREASQIEAKTEATSEVKAAESAGRVYPTKTDDRYYTYLWNLTNASNGRWGVDAEDAWPLSTGRNAVIGVIDTGITPHPDLAAHVVAGYDFFGRDTNPTDDGPRDVTDYHGTHVAGIAAALANTTGVVGVAPNALIEPIRVIGAIDAQNAAGSDEDLAAAILWGAGIDQAGATRKNAHKADVLNLSLGSSGDEYQSCPTAIQTAINQAVSHGTAVVVAAGNGDHSGNGVPIDGVYPANCKNVIRVTASGNDGLRTTYSNYGTSSYTATIAAPGGSANNSYDTDPGHWILSTWNKAAKKPTASSATYVGFTGTSMAAPHVSGIVALLRSANKGLTVDQITTILTSTAKPLSDSCSPTVCGAGVANAAASVAAALGKPVPSAHPSLTRPTIAGKMGVGEKLSVTTAVSPAGSTLSYQWLRSGKAIKGGTHATFTPSAKDKGKKLSVSVTVTYGLSKARATSPTRRIVAGTFVNNAAPTISGTFAVGKKLTATRGVWSPAPKSYQYQWYRNSTKISGATSKTYKLRAADRGTSISIKVTVRRAAVNTASARSIRYLVA